MDNIGWFLSLPIVQAAWVGVVGAAAVDFSAFRAWKQWRDAVTYDWSVATFRWAQGAFFGVLGYYGLVTVQGVL